MYRVISEKKQTARLWIAAQEDVKAQDEVVIKSANHPCTVANGIVSVDPIHFR